MCIFFWKIGILMIFVFIFFEDDGLIFIDIYDGLYCGILMFLLLGMFVNR